MAAESHPGAHPTASATDAANGEGQSLARLDDGVRRAMVQNHRVQALLVQDNFRHAVDTVALMELLIAKGVIGLVELDARRKQVEEQMAAQRAQAWTGPQLYPATPEELARPATSVDCAPRLSQCQAACCRIYVVHLTAEEVRSGRYLWDLGEPYRLMRRDDGSCHYLDEATLACRIWHDRPYVCRRYSCSEERQIWDDFSQQVVSENLVRVRARWSAPAAPEGASATVTTITGEAS